MKVKLTIAAVAAALAQSPNPPAASGASKAPAKSGA